MVPKWNDEIRAFKESRRRELHDIAHDHPPPNAPPSPPPATGLTQNVASMAPSLIAKKNWIPLLACTSVSARGSIVALSPAAALEGNVFVE